MLQNISKKIFFKPFFFAFYFCFLLTSVISLNPQKVFAISVAEIEANYIGNGSCTKTSNSITCAIFKSQQDPSKGTEPNTEVNYSNCDFSKGTCESAAAGKSVDLETERINKLKSPGSCNIFNFSVANCFISILDVVGAWIIGAINGLLGYILWASSLVLDFTIYFSIVKFKTNFADLKAGGLGTVIIGSNSGGLIYYMWGMIRDFLNIIIFIIIIYSAVVSMFEGFENTRKRFITLLVFSIVTNFSLLFVKFAIDISNILALQAYTLAVKPSSTESFFQFRTSGTGNVKSYGEYIMTSIDMEKLVNKQTGTAVAKAELDNMKNTFMFQLGKMVVYIGVIYVLLFIAGTLIMRAVGFLMAMILAPLIAADVFFDTFDKNSRMDSIAKSLKSITGKVKEDFYEGLVKGPLLIFFIFLIGVFAESILSQGVMDQLNQSISQMKDVQNMDSSLTKSIFIFFKFALFMALCKLLFEKIQSMSNFGGSGKLNKFGSGFANYLVGKGIGGAGWVGRNVISRRLANTGIGKNALDYLSTRSVALQQSKSIFSPITNRVGKLGSSAVAGIRGGSFDLRNAGLGADGKPNALGGLIKNINGVVGAKDIDLGKGAEGGYEYYDKKRKDFQVSKIDADIKTAQASVTATEKMKDAVSKETDVKLGTSFNGKIKELDDLLNDNKFTDALKNSAGGFSVVDSGGTRRTVSDKDLQKFKKLAENQGEFYIEKTGKEKTALDKKVENERDRVGKELRRQAEESERLGSLHIIEKARDRIAGRNVAGPDGSVAMEYQEQAVKKYKEKAKEGVQKFSVVSETKKDLESTLKQVEEALKLDAAVKALDPTDPTLGLKPEQISDLNKLKTELENPSDGLLDATILSGATDNMSNTDKANLARDFGKENVLHDRIASFKDSAAKTLTNIYDESRTNSDNQKVKTNFKKIKEERDSASATLKAYNRTTAPDPTLPAAAGAPLNASGRPMTPFEIYSKTLNDAEKKHKELSDLYDSKEKTLEKATKLQEKASKYKEKIADTFGPKKTP